jgi:hypothetical protein
MSGQANRRQPMNRFLALALLLALLLVPPVDSACAQDLHAIRFSCWSDAQNLCSNNKHEADAIRQCLLSRRDQLSAGCKADLFSKR